MKKIGSKLEVYSGIAMQTPGGLAADDLVVNKKGIVVSRARSAAASARFRARGGIAPGRIGLAYHQGGGPFLTGLFGALGDGVRRLF